ncbi:MAG: NB-ARC domain-containing protein [Gaiellales bacterium]
MSPSLRVRVSVANRSWRRWSRFADTRLLTLTGPGGTGKTRLAAQAAATSSDSYPDGIWWVPLETLRDPTLVLEAVAQALGAKQEVAQHIADQRMLILLDSFEGVVEAARDVSELVARCPNRVGGGAGRITGR